MLLRAPPNAQHRCRTLLRGQKAGDDGPGPVAESADCGHVRLGLELLPKLCAEENDFLNGVHCAK